MSQVIGAVNRVLSATVGRFLQAMLIGLIVGYRAVLSPLLGPRCRFYPSCSANGLEAIRVHGAAKGTVLATARVARCHPWNSGGVDPVPAKGTWTSEPYVSLERHATSAATAAHPTDPTTDPTTGRSAA